MWKKPLIIGAFAAVAIYVVRQLKTGQAILQQIKKSIASESQSQHQDGRDQSGERVC